MNKKHAAAAAALLVPAVAVAAVLLARSHDGTEEPAHRPQARSSPASPSASPTPTPADEPPVPEGPVLGVKLDNAAPARPHTGLEEADVVHVERVEAGLSRFLAVYASGLPDVVGPVRSARETDLELLAQYDDPVLAYSGAQSRLKPYINRAPLRPVPPEQLPGAYFRGTDRPVPHNLYLRPDALTDAAPELADLDAPPPYETGEAPAGGRRTGARTVEMPAASFTFDWSAERRGWEVWMDGTAATSGGERLAPPTVVLQETTIRKGRFGDRWGNNSPFTETVGSGEATVLRDGRAYAAEWDRQTAADRTVFTTPDGDPMPLAKGQVWVVYVPRG
ncbi:DUF3048 domain-containing protein [Streptomyces sp. WMMC500]|uniref:DUF3048 domain-containing protein n=1 Tax=Streptomyces sp. WMMC500 TaxID=3015154 RepID=UPI00248B1EDE|nr:DUF3048 domain-containing protein [Streptomyces sp. WMMC500]WBB61394.1 DUF3048 domain-containing protein [Streptomyces sp. WMMC500]